MLTIQQDTLVCVPRPFSRSDAPLVVQPGGAQQTWLRVLSLNVKNLCPWVFSGCFSLLILLPVDAEIKASITVI